MGSRYSPEDPIFWVLFVAILCNVCLVINLCSLLKYPSHRNRSRLLLGSVCSLVAYSAVQYGNTANLWQLHIGFYTSYYILAFKAASSSVWEYTISAFQTAVGSAPSWIDIGQFISEGMFVVAGCISFILVLVTSTRYYILVGAFAIALAASFCGMILVYSVLKLKVVVKQTLESRYAAVDTKFDTMPSNASSLDTPSPSPMQAGKMRLLALQRSLTRVGHSACLVYGIVIFIIAFWGRDVLLDGDTSMHDFLSENSNRRRDSYAVIPTTFICFLFVYMENANTREPTQCRPRVISRACQMSRRPISRHQNEAVAVP